MEWTWYDWSGIVSGLAYALTAGRARSGAIVSHEPDEDSWQDIHVQQFIALILEVPETLINQSGEAGKAASAAYGRFQDMLRQRGFRPRTGARRSDYAYAMRNACQGRSIFLTTDGRVGIGSLAVKPGDQICVLKGGRVPFLLQGDTRLTRTLFYNLVSPCYLQSTTDKEFDTQMQGKVEEFIMLLT
jgi:hypothetical protein